MKVTRCGRKAPTGSASLPRRLSCSDKEAKKFALPDHEWGAGCRWQAARSPLKAVDGRRRVHTIVFNIGRSMEEIEAQIPLIADRCNSLARVAGVQAGPIPSAAALRQRLQARPGNDVEVCGGQSATLTFQITALHDDRHWRHGGDYRRANFDGYLGTPTE